MISIIKQHFGVLLVSLLIGMLIYQVYSWPEVPMWENIPYSMGGVKITADENGYPCFYFRTDNQLICFEEKDTWYGRAAVPKYVIENGVRTPLF